MTHLGVVAAGHTETANSAALILKEGGNAFDAAIAALFTACVSEPVLASLGGGGFLLAQANQQPPTLYDFFVQTPGKSPKPEQIDFYPISADFGTTQQEFHIGLGSIATPGMVKGIFEVHRQHGTIPMAQLVEPAIKLAKNGVKLNDFQAYIHDIVSPILLATPESAQLFGKTDAPDTPKESGELFSNPQLADTLESLAREGEALFYQGEIAKQISQHCQQQGGLLTASDLSHYQTIKRQPLELTYRKAKILTNPPPSSGGILIAFALKLLSSINPKDSPFGSSDHLSLLAKVMELTNKARLDAHIEQGTPDSETLLDPEFIEQYRSQVHGHRPSLRGTTHISIIDKENNCASVTVSNGEGCGHIVPGTGIMLNNMLGEEDLNPTGFHRWQCNQRMTSMMSPSMIQHPEGEMTVLGSGGSNRIRTALLQVISNLLDYQMPLQQAVHAPRIHLENQHLSIEGGFSDEAIAQLLPHYPDHQQWQEHNLFFGGCHVAHKHSGEFQGVGDPRRGGVAVIV